MEISTTCHLLDIGCVCRRLVAARGKPTAWADRQSEGTQGSEHVASCCCSSLWDLLSTFHTVHMKAESFFAPLLAMCDPDLWMSLPAKRLLWAWRRENKKNGFVVCGDFLFLTQLVREVVFCSCYCWRFVRSFLRCKSVKQVKESNRCFWWICGRLRNESSSEAPAALPAVLLLWSRAGRRHLARAGHPGTRWDLNIDTEAERACVRLLYKSVQISAVGYLVKHNV